MEAVSELVLSDDELDALEELIESKDIDERNAAFAMSQRLVDSGPPGKKNGRTWFAAAALYASRLTAARRRIRELEAAEGQQRPSKPIRCIFSKKVIFTSERAARRSMRNKKDRLRSYRCPDCHGYHLTSSVGR